MPFGSEGNSYAEKKRAMIETWRKLSGYEFPFYFVPLAKAKIPLLHAISNNTIALAKGQSMYGTFGHGFSELTPDGKLHGSIPPYGPVNAAGLAANIGIVMGKKCGLKDPEIDPAIDRASKFFGYFVDKGAIPYGEHEPWPYHGSNGKTAMTAVLFALQGNRVNETRFFAKMSTAAYRNREYGHTGQGFSYLWGALGANTGGPAAAAAAAAFCGEASWHLDLVRRCDGSFTYDGGEFMLFSNEQGMGTGPVTLYEKGQIWLVISHEITNRLISYGGLIRGQSRWNAPVTLNGDLRLAGNLTFHENGLGMSGLGGLTMVGSNGPFGWLNRGTIQLHGPNTYAGPTTVRRGTLSLKKAVALYNGNRSKWTPANISVHAPATLRISVGGKDEFTGQQVGTLLKNLTTGINNNGLMGGSFFCMDTANATETISIPTNITDSNGVGGGWFFFKKAGSGTVELTGTNTYTGQTFIEAGTLSVASLNSISGGKPSASLGAPTTPEAGTIEMAGDCGLTYTGKGELTDRILDLTGNNPQTVTFTQSGSGLLKFTSNFVFTGFGHNKTIVLQGDTAGTGEIAGDITNPYDRKSIATTAITKDGTGGWTLSGVNSFTGPTTVNQGTLSLASVHSLSDKAEVHVSEGATLSLDFQGDMRIGKLYLDGQLQPAGTYSTANVPKYIKGAGVLRNQR